MKERPIIFSGPMVRAILEGRKTQTRWVVKPRPTVEPDGSIRFLWATFFPNGHVHTWARSGCGGENWMAQDYPNENKFEQALQRTPYSNPCPYGVPGDRLWVKETWQEHAGRVCYKAGIPPFTHNCCQFVGHLWRSPIHMPRRLSRITLEIESVRVEKLQEISEADAKAEGCHRACELNSPPISSEHGHGYFHPTSFYDGFSHMWCATEGHESWKSNPWVWVLSFKKV